MSKTNQRTSGLTIRHAGTADLGALAHLAALDSATAPEGPALIAESGGRIVAAVPFAGGRAIADPFEPTAEVLALLELRARQLSEADGRRRRRTGLRRLLRTSFA
jgi:hypothetical protein